MAAWCAKSTDVFIPGPKCRPRNGSCFGLLAVAGVFGGVGVWAATAPLESAIVASGQVAVDSKRRQIQHLEGGIVDEILVRDGDETKAGQVLVRLQSIRARASLAVVDNAMDKEHALIARLRAERDKKSSITFASALLAKQSDPDTNDLLEGQRTIFHHPRAHFERPDRNPRATDLTAGKGNRGSRCAAEVQAAADRAVRRGNRRPQPARRKRPSAQTAPACHSSAQAVRLEGEVGELIAAIARSNKAIGEARLEIIQLRERFFQDVVQQLEEARERLKELKERRSAAQDVMSRIDIRSPVAGVVVGSKVSTIGAVIKAGETIMELVPRNDRLIIEIRVRPQDIDNISIGQTSRVRFLAFKQRTTPEVLGQVSYVSADSLAHADTGQAYYLARVAVSKGELARLEDQNIVPGMPVEVLIRTGARTPLEYLTQPLLDSLNKAWREE